MSERQTLTPVRRRAVQALLSAVTLEEAAEQARVRPETLWRWLGGDSAFQQAVKEERGRLRVANCIAVEALLGLAVETLEKAMHDEALPPEVRLEASKATFEIAVQLYRLTALEDRLAALEAWSKGRADKAKAAGAADRAA